LLRIIDKKEELAKIEEVILNYIGDLKKWFVSLISSSTYPNIAYRDIELWVRNLGLYDKNFKSYNFSVIFSTVNYEEK
jgi:hypothetical protein